MRRLGRWLPLLLVPTALLPDLAAALPLRTYFFRDFTVGFLPLRLFAAREMREGRIALWNPLVFEGSFQLPALYPPDLLHALWPSPVFVSWLLTLHLPLAALAAYWLARELGASRPGAFQSGAVYALGGFALSCLNLYVFLQALALAPFVAGLLRRAALRGGRQVPAAALVLALALSTIAVEFVAQAVVLGGALGLAFSPRRQTLGRLALAVLLGVGLAGLPVALVVGLLPETARGAGLAPDVVLANAVHPAVLLQALLPNLFGVPQAPAEAWWGGRFFSKGLPYFLSLYFGPLTLALAALGAFALPRRTRLVVLGLAVLGLWYALGERGGLASLVARLPLASSFRFPAKALLLPHFAVALASGFGVDRLRVASRPWAPFAGSPGGRRGRGGAGGGRRVEGRARRPRGVVRCPRVLLAAAGRGRAARRGARAAGRGGRSGRGLGRAPRNGPAGSGHRPGGGPRRGRPRARGLRAQPAGAPVVLRSASGDGSPASARPRGRPRVLLRARPQPGVPGVPGARRPGADPRRPLPAPSDARPLHEHAGRPSRAGGDGSHRVLAPPPRARARELRAAGRGPPAPVAPERRGDARAQPRPADARRAGSPRHRRPRPARAAHPPLRGRVCVAANARRLPRDRGARSRAGPSTALLPGIRPATRRGPRAGAGVGRGRTARRDVHAGPGPAHGGVVGRGAHRGRGERQRLPRRPRQLRPRLAGARRRGAGARSSAPTASTGRWPSRRGSTRSCCATSRRASPPAWP